MTYGTKTWLIGDNYLNSVSKNGSRSHESICVLNTSDTDAKIKLTLYFEDREPDGSFESFCGARRTHHIRLDKIRSADGRGIPMDVPYAVLLESDVDVVVQCTRLDTSEGGMALMTTIAYPV